MCQTQCTVRLVGVLMFIALLCGCSSMTMQKTSLVSTPQGDAALVTFVRPAVFLGDGVSVDIWDGDSFVGVLAAGTLVQHEVKPGEHLFLAKAENWSYTTANLLPGKKYFVKANIFPGVLYARVALAAVPKTDSRIEEWLSKLKPMSILPADKQTRESDKQNEVRAVVMEFKTGKVTSFGELRPEDGL
jgi:hypothetical protein